MVSLPGENKLLKLMEELLDEIHLHNQLMVTLIKKMEEN